MQVGALAAQIDWERSRLSHHAKRMESCGLVEFNLATQDRRATEFKLTADGRRAIVRAAPATSAWSGACSSEDYPRTCCLLH
jgi:DNA-binding MarR family transcriptional regulator